MASTIASIKSLIHLFVHLSILQIVKDVKIIKDIFLTSIEGVVCQITYHKGRYVKLSDEKMYVKSLARNLTYSESSSFYIK